MWPSRKRASSIKAETESLIDNSIYVIIGQEGEGSEAEEEEERAPSPSRTQPAGFAALAGPGADTDGDAQDDMGDAPGGPATAVEGPASHEAADGLQVIHACFPGCISQPLWPVHGVVHTALCV
jgi:hypothetical protein